MEVKKMSKKAILILMSIFFSISFTPVSFAESLKIGTEAPAFKVKSGDDKILTLDMIRGKLTVIFYETKDVVEKNRKLKDELNKFHDGQPDTIKELIVKLTIDNFAQQRIKEKSKISLNCLRQLLLSAKHYTPLQKQKYFIE